MKKRDIIIYIVILVGVILLSFASSYLINNNDKSELPTPVLSEGLRGVYGIDKNINETTIDNYLGRSDTVYRDLRMLVDTASWENKGGDRYLSGIIEGFEVVPYPFIAGFTEEYVAQKVSENVSGLYEGETLFSLDENNVWKANYEESIEILEYLFPKDKNVFLMCGAGGYAGVLKKMLISLGWDENKVYNIGGYWYYDGEHNIEIKNTNNGEVTYDFWKVLYHDIDFNNLHKMD